MSTNDHDSDHVGDDDDPFVNRLRAQQPATLPAHWRANILAAARFAAAPATAPPRRRRTTEWIQAWLWPHPGAYAALSAGWLVVIALRLTTPSPTPSITFRNSAPLVAQMDYPLALAREQLTIDTVLSAASRQREARP